MQAKSLQHEIRSLAHQYIPESTFSIVIKNQEENNVIYSKDANKLLMPASGSKLFPAFAAFYQWPDNYHFNTSLAKKGANYYITFNGSPALTQKQ